MQVNDSAASICGFFRLRRWSDH